MASTITKFAHLRIPLEDVLKATNNFHHDNIIGRGGFGTAYKGQLQLSGELIKIAALRLDRKQGEGDLEFWTEISMLSDLKHRNLVSLVGFSDENDEKIIVTTHVVKGSLQEHLNSPDLTWTQRLKICVGVAHALSYLHYDEGRGYGVIHLNINSSTILLDDNWEPKLSGFKVSLKRPLNQMDRVFICEPIGTIGYVDPEIEKARGVTYKSDIYSFGVVLFEILCGRKAYIKNEEKGFLAPLATCHYENETLEDIIHDDLWYQMSPGLLKKYSTMAYSCLKTEQPFRPDTNNIVEELEKLLELQLRHENLVKNLGHLKIPFSDIQLATNDFSNTYTVEYSGEHTFYRVELDHYDKENHSFKKHNTVVIKRYPSGHHMYGDGHFFTEIETLSSGSVKHPNIVTLLGFCVDASEMIVVIENFSNGFLGEYLNENNEKRHILTWEKRLKICNDVAHTLKYIHSKMMINRDIWSYNIGLDDNGGAKIVDFCVSVFLPSNKKDDALYLAPVGREPYIDLEYDNTRKLKKESDVYSFGVLLFEILCGRVAFDPIYRKENEKGLAFVARRSISMGTLEEIIDPIIKEEISENNFDLKIGPKKDSLHAFIELAHQCVAETQDRRPTMKVVVKEIEKAALFFQQSKKEDPLGNFQKLRMSLEDIDVVTQNFHDDNCIKFQKERIQRSNAADQDVDKFEKLQLTCEIPLKNLEHMMIPLTHIQSATDYFSSTYIIKSSEGCTLYRAELDHYDNENPQSKRRSTVLIKRYPHIHHRFYGEKQFITEIKTLTNVKHPNIVTLLGYCVEASEMILVIENVSKGFLGDYLGNHNNMPFLNWKKRLKICIDIAHALKYIHYEKMIINRDIWGYNIGLDENWGAKIVHFWWSVFLPPNQEDEALDIDKVRRPPYFDPNYKKTYKVKRELDVYSFGVVLLEILSGRLSYEESICMGELEDMMDPILKTEASENKFVLTSGPTEESLRTFFKIIQQCMAKTQDEQPTMEVVAKELEKALFSEEKNKDSPRISLEDINQATQNFNKDNCIGEGGFGKVYKGNLQDGDGFKTIVAKRLDTRFGQGEQQFLTELQILLEYKHENIIGFLGYCDEKGEKIIVYEYASRSSLDRYLNHASLTWMKRLNICIDVASALDFLHAGHGKHAKVVHRDIKAANILLNHDWKAKLADFGLSLISSITQESDYIINIVCGTIGYVDPLYKNSRFLTIESDIYSFGVVLFEILCGRSTFETKKLEGHYLPDFIKKRFEEGKHDEMVFEQIREQIEPKSLSTFQKIAYQCLHHEREKRPVTRKVLAELKKALVFQNMVSTITLQIPLEGVLKATNNFHDNRIARKCSNMTTYTGKLQQSGKLIEIAAIRFDSKQLEREVEFWTEILVLSDLKHTNLLSFIGFCDEKDEKIIITTFPTKFKSLNQQLKNPDLTWTHRLRICVGLARAMSYLHYDHDGRGYTIIHRLINSNTILLDENIEAMLSCFHNCVKHFYHDQVHYCEPRGVLGYTDPTIRNMGVVTHKSDIYSFGVVLFEVLCGREAYIENEDNRFLSSLVKIHYNNKTLKDLILPSLWNHMSQQSLLIFSEVAYSCLDEEPTRRPNMNYIVAKLEKALELHVLPENFNMVSVMALQMPLEDIVLATNNFHDDNIIGVHTGLGEVYKGCLLQSGLLIIAALRVNRINGEGDVKFWREISRLADLKHKNLVSIVGFCDEKHEKIIITTRSSRGSLHNYLKNPILTWTQRLRICVGVAHALSYLHYDDGRGYTVIHCSINSKSIELDKNWEAKLTYFCNSIKHFCEDLVHPCETIGIPGYEDPAIKNHGGVTHKSDIYTFGVVLFEMLCGREAYIEDEANRFLAPLAKYHYKNKTLKDIIFPDLWPQMSHQSLLKYSEVAYSCLEKEPKDRPGMDYIVAELEKALKLQVRHELSKFFFICFFFVVFLVCVIMSTTSFPLFNKDRELQLP